MFELKVLWILTVLISALNLILVCKEHMETTEPDDTIDNIKTPDE